MRMGRRACGNRPRQRTTRASSAGKENTVNARAGKVRPWLAFNAPLGFSQSMRAALHARNAREVTSRNCMKRSPAKPAPAVACLGHSCYPGRRTAVYASYVRLVTQVSLKPWGRRARVVAWHAPKIGQQAKTMAALLCEDADARKTGTMKRMRLPHYCRHHGGNVPGVHPAQTALWRMACFSQIYGQKVVTGDALRTPASLFPAWARTALPKKRPKTRRSAAV